MHLGDVTIRSPKNGKDKHVMHAYIRGISVKGVRLEKDVITQYFVNKESMQKEVGKFAYN